MATKNDIPQRDLTVYLLKANVAKPSDALRKPAGLKHFPISTSGAAAVGDLYVRPPASRPPRWATFFEGHVKLGELGRVASTSAVLLVKTNDRLFAVTFGQGRHLLAPDCWEERFGLKVVLNSIEPDHLRSLDKRTFDALSTQSRTQSNREGSAPDFGLDIEQDLVRAVTGTPANDSIGKTLSGMDSLHSSVRVTVETLRALLRQYYLKSEGAAYKSTFPWVDHIAEVTDGSLVAQLDAKLVTVVNGSRERCWLCVPEIIDWALTGGFRYLFTAKAPEYPDLHFDEFLESVSGGTADIDVLKRRRAHRISNEGQVLEEWSIYKCIYCELELQGLTYILSAGKWYRVETSFVTAVNSFFSGLPQYGHVLPEYNDASEGKYCERVSAASPASYALMDQKSIPIGGAYGKVEFCDLFTPAKDLIHIKHYGASSVLSHLFSQGLVSGESFRADADFRSEVLNKLPNAYHFFSAADALDATQYQIVFAVISNRSGPLALPFFSRVNLRHACRRLNAFGFRTAIAKIPVAAEKAKLKKYAPK